MAESPAVRTLPSAEPLLEKVLSCDSQEASSPQEHLPACNPMRLCFDESPALVPSRDKDKECSNSRTIYSLGANQCFRCLITFPDEKFKERHMKREHPEDFVQAYLRDALFVCFICNKAFESSQALICHQRGHAPTSPSECRECTKPASDCLDCGHHFGLFTDHPSHRPDHSLPHQCPDCSKSFRQLSHLRHHQTFHQQTQELVPAQRYSCTECGENFSREAGLHEHYIRHARGKLQQWL